MTSRLRLIFHTPTLSGGGAERVFVLMANEMARRGHDVTMFVWNREGPNADLLEAQVRLVSLDIPRPRNLAGRMVFILGVLRSALLFRRERPNAVLSALEFANLLMALALNLSASKARFFPSYHAAAELRAEGLAYRILPLLERVIVRRATKAIGVSRGVSEGLRRRGFRPGQIVTIHNPVPAQETRDPTRHAWEEKLAALGTGPVIATLGRLVPVKDHQTLLEAFCRLRSQAGCRLVIFGDGPLKNELQAQAKALQVDDRVLFAGYADDTAACYAAADLVVSSSRSEGFGNVLVEALAAGVPVVSTDAPYGPREILADGEFGTLVPVGDVDALAAAMAFALEQPPEPDKLKARAEAFSLAKIGDRYEALLLTGGPAHSVDRS